MTCYYQNKAWFVILGEILPGNLLQILALAMRSKSQAGTFYFIFYNCRLIKREVNCYSVSICSVRFIEVSSTSQEKKWRHITRAPLQDVWRVLHSVPSCKHRHSALLPQIPLPVHVLEASLTVAESFCSVFRADAAAVIVTLAEQLCCVSFGSRLLFASATPEFSLQSFEREKVSCTTFFLPFLLPFLSYSVRPCGINKDYAVQAKWKWRKGVL